jgi:NADPH:quinone reductase-like Zn-dependent oxidoreductase
MKAIVHDKYGTPEVLELREIDRPVLKDDEVLVRVRAAAVNPPDWARLRGVPYIVRLAFGVRRPTLLSLLVSQRIHPVTLVWSQDDLLAINELLASGKVAPIIDRTYPLSETREAIRYFGEGHARGKVVITV